MCGFKGKRTDNHCETTRNTTISGVRQKKTPVSCCRIFQAAHNHCHDRIDLIARFSVYHVVPSCCCMQATSSNNPVDCHHPSVFHVAGTSLRKCFGPAQISEARPLGFVVIHILGSSWLSHAPPELRAERCTRKPQSKPGR